MLIIQSDDFVLEGNIICESEKGESYILELNDLINMIKEKEIKYKVIILCFPNSSLMKKFFDENLVNIQYLITFDYFDISQINDLKIYNEKYIQFLIDFIINITDKNNNYDINNIFEKAKNDFIKNKVFLFNKKTLNTKIEYHKEIDENKIYLYDPLLKLDNIDKKSNIFQDISSKVYKLIEIINSFNKNIFYCNKSNKSLYLNISIETMKFYHRHKIYCEYLYIDIEKGDKSFLKSVIRKLNKIKDEDNEINNNNEIDEKIQQKACFILINNCHMLDLIDINIYSILKSNSSFIILYDMDNYDIQHNENGKLQNIEDLKEINYDDLNLFEKELQLEYPEEKQPKYDRKTKIKKVYEGKKVKEISLQFLNNYKISPLIKGAQFNIFFIIPLLEKKLPTIYLSAYVN